LLLVVLLATAHMLRFTVAVDDAFIASARPGTGGARGARVQRRQPRMGTHLLAWVALLAGLDRVLPWSLPLIAQPLGGVCGLATIVVLAVGFPARAGRDRCRRAVRHPRRGRGR
jgi:hypothetical protein